MGWPARLGLRTRFTVTVAALVFAVAGLFGSVIGQRAINQLQERVGQSLFGDAQRIAERLNREMADRSRDLGLIGALNPMRSLKDAGAVQTLLDSVRRSQPDYLWLAVTDLQGQVIAASDGSMVGNDLSTLYDLRDQLRGRPTSTADPLHIVRPGDPPGASTPIRALNFSRPIRGADGTAVGVIAAQLSWDSIRDSVTGLISRDGDGQVHRQFIVISSTDTVLLGPPELIGRKLVIPASSRARAGIFGWSTEEWPDGSRYIAGVSFAAGEGQFPGPGSAPMQWTVLVRELEDTAFAPAAELQVQIFAVGALLAVAVAACGWVIAGVLTGPLRRITQAADRLRCGELVELPNLRGPREVEVLTASLRALVATLTFKQGKLDELETASQRDPLTGLLNRTGLQFWLARALPMARAEPAGLLVLAGDLDGFKEINDTRGHAAGDFVLQEVGRRLQASVRTRDAVARMGGDEFVIILHAPLGLEDRMAVETAQRIWARVTEPYELGSEFVFVGLSLGGAGWPEDDRQWDVVLNKADAALYAAKRAGKGRIIFHREPALG